MRKQTKKVLSMVLSAALAITAFSVPSAKYAGAADDVKYEGAIDWNAGADGDCRIEIVNTWGKTPIPEKLNGLTFTDLEVSFKITGVAAALKAANVTSGSAAATIFSDAKDWAAATTGAAIKADGTYTVTLSTGDDSPVLINDVADSFHFLAVRIEDFDALFKANSESVPKFEDVKIKVINKSGKDLPVPTPGTYEWKLPAYLDSAVWGATGYHAYIMYQIDGSWDYRNGYKSVEAVKASAKKADDWNDSYWYIKAGGAEVDASKVVIKDVLLSKDGTYTVSMKGTDLSAGTGLKMLGVATDIDKTKAPGITVTNASLKVDDKEVKSGMSLFAKPDDDCYNFMVANDYAKAGETYPMEPKDFSDKLPTDSVEISFTIKGIPTAAVATKAPVATTAPAKAPAKGKSFTVGNFKYKVTKAVSGSKKGKVTLTGLSKKGKKASTLKVGTTVKKVGTFTISALGKNAFKGAKAKSITLSKNIKKIPAGAFVNCKKLTKLTVKAKLSSVAKKSFKGCKKKITVKGASKKVNKANVKKLKKSGYKKFK